MKSHLLDLIKNAGHSKLLEIQSQTIDAFKSNKNVVLQAATGSGKTLAFLLAALEKTDPNLDHGILVIAPGRELCLQIEAEFKALKTGKKVLTCYGGHSFETEQNSLLDSPFLLIATPGRICDHIRRKSQLDLEKYPTLVIDEFDKTLEQRFEEELSFFKDHLQSNISALLVSATNRIVIPSFMRFDNPIWVSSDKDNVSDIEYWGVQYSDQGKEELLQLLSTLSKDKSIIFCNYREVVDDVVDILRNEGIPTVRYHGGLDQLDRERALILFGNDTSNILVCTDLGARGIHIDNVQHVIHFQSASSEEAYVHRNGRTGRMGNSGNIYIFIPSSGDLPYYVAPPTQFKELKRSVKFQLPANKTIYFGAGKKEKINKVDLVGFIARNAGIDKLEIGKINVLDHHSFVAINRTKYNKVFDAIKGLKIKGKRVIIRNARLN